MTTLDFDYVIVGGGAAGCVLAARLATDSDARVALVERGRRDRNPWIHIPATFFKALQSQDAEAVVSEPDRSLGDIPFRVPQGRVLGGGSSVNGMIYMRGQAQDYDDWVRDYGCDGWGYDDVLPVFRRQERNLTFHDGFHGTEGALKVSHPSAPHPVSKRVIDAALAAGLPLNEDFNGAQQEGVGWYQVMAAGGQRQSAAHCFLRPALRRPNLTVLTNMSAQQVQFTGRKATALAVIDPNGQLLIIRAHREIVLTAGSFQSPKLLMLSGIGPANELAHHGVDVVHANDQVGANYQDHIGVPVTRQLHGISGLHGQDQGVAAIKHGLNFLMARRGLLTSNLLDAGACVDTDGDGRPDVQYNFAPFAPGAPGQPPLDCHAVQVHPMTMRPKSRGRLTLASTDPAAAPTFEAHALSAAEDLATLRRGVRVAQSIMAQSALSEVLGDEIWPPPNSSWRSQNDAFDDAIRRHARTIYHPAGTCRMGPDGDAVTDLKLRVQGVEGLRVADCSIMPQLVSGNTCAPTMMIADRAADFVLEDA